MASTILGFAQEKNGTYKALREAAQAALAQTTQESDNAQNEYDSTAGEYADLEKQIKDKRKEIAGALMSADIEALADELRNLTIQLRNKHAELLAAEDEIASVKRRLAQAEEQLKRSKNMAAESEKELKAAQDRDANHTKWREAITGGSLAELAGMAQTLLSEIAEDANGDDGGGGNGDGDGDGDGDGNGNGNGNGDGNGNGNGDGNGNGNGDGNGGDSEAEDELAEEKQLIKAARDRISGDFPTTLLARARERGGQVRTEIAAVADLLDAIQEEEGKLWQSNGGDSGKVAKLWGEFLKAELAFKDYVLLSASDYKQAQALLKSVTVSAQLTGPERAQINDIDVITDGAAAIVAEKERDDARAAVRAREAELELALAKAYAADINADPEDDTDVQNIRSDLESLNTALSTAEGAYSTEMRDNLDRWEASVPDLIWVNLTSYDRAVILLAEIRDGDAAALAATMDNAEEALAEALTEQDEGLRTSYVLDDSISLLYDRLDYENNARQQRILSAVRGDN